MNKGQIESQAIDAAIAGRWAEAIKLNKQLLELNGADMPTLLRLAYAYLQSASYKNARKMYKAVIEIQPSHPIANENIERIEVLEQRDSKPQSKKGGSSYNPSLFLEVPGKTKASVLVNLGQRDILALLNIGDELEMKLRKRKIEIRTKDSEYVGSLPDDLSKRLYVFIKADSVYSCYIKEISLSRVVVFIKEESKAKRVQRYTSFPRNIQSNLQAMQEGAEGNADAHSAAETEDDDSSNNELERLAENLGQEDKVEFFNVERNDGEDEENLSD